MGCRFYDKTGRDRFPARRSFLPQDFNIENAEFAETDTVFLCGLSGLHVEVFFIS